MRIRKASMKDWPAVKKILQATRFSKADITDVWDILETGNGGSFVAVARGKVIGTISGHWHDRKPYVEQIAVLPNHQGKGIGQMLMKRIIRFFRDKGNKKIYAEGVKKMNCGFYAWAGFRKKGRELALKLK